MLLRGPDVPKRPTHQLQKQHEEQKGYNRLPEQNFLQGVRRLAYPRRN